MSDTPDDYDPNRAEPKWQEQWQEMDVYEYEGGHETGYLIDTPPPYPTGNFHIGNALGWCYMDFTARYKRLQGFDVDFPQGWDCHGLPTEVKVEEKHDIHRTDVPRDEFRELCIEHTEEQIKAMKQTMRTLGFSQDWSREFRTMDPEYWGETQRSVVRMADSGYLYQDQYPVNWCPRCETAIADAEVETEENVQGTLYYIDFPGADDETDPIEIATTRPELLPACVGIAVSSDDERFAGRVGDQFEVPLFGQEVELISDEEVDADFGTGAVMICTFGDKQDVDWWAEYDLDLRTVLNDNGRLNEKAGEYAGISAGEAKDEIAADLDEEGFLTDSEPTAQNIGRCWRCDTPIEILSKEQWFVEIREDEILSTAKEVDWIPEFMYDRLRDWTESMEWDWVISRQRVFATPIPAWFCEQCGHAHVADEETVPVDPTEVQPSIDECPECGATEWRGETDVMDTWMDSSITPLYAQGWPDEEFTPRSLREQGHDIIRTWAFYTILRVAALEDEKPWDDALINGMVFGEGGQKMSKSRGNYVQPEEVVEEYSADAFRQAMALAGKPGEDVQFQWKEVTSASRFNTKVWNIVNFASQHLVDGWDQPGDPTYRDTDRWIISRSAETAAAVAEYMDEYRFDAALREIREFIWHDLADDYLELVKGRIYGESPAERDTARCGLFEAVTAGLTMLAPFAPFLAEEAWQRLPTDGESVHQTDWPTPERDHEAERAGALIADVAATVRNYKSESGIPLNAEIESVEVYPDDNYDTDISTLDLSNAVNGDVRIESGQPEVKTVLAEVTPDYQVIGPEFRDRADQVAAALESMGPEETEKRRLDGGISADVDGEELIVPEDAYQIKEEDRSKSGEEVVVLESDLATVLIYK